jgi:hypothetical protein
MPQPFFMHRLHRHRSLTVIFGVRHPQPIPFRTRFGLLDHPALDDRRSTVPDCPGPDRTENPFHLFRRNTVDRQRQGRQHDNAAKEFEILRYRQ